MSFYCDWSIQMMRANDFEPCPVDTFYFAVAYHPYVMQVYLCTPPPVVLHVNNQHRLTIMIVNTYHFFRTKVFLLKLFIVLCAKTFSCMACRQKWVRARKPKVWWVILHHVTSYDIMWQAPRARVCQLFLLKFVVVVRVPSFASSKIPFLQQIS